MPDQLDERGDPISKTHEPDKKQFSATEARPGRPGAPVLMVLGVSLVLAFAVWGAVEIWGRSTAPADPVGSSQTSTTPDGAQPSATGETTGETFDDNPPQGTTGQTVPTDQDPTPQSGTGGDSQSVTPDGTAE